MKTRADVTAAALLLEGTPFHEQGRVPGVGLDCIGVGVCVARACGFEVSDIKGYPLRPNGQLQPALEKRMNRVHGEPQEGDVLLMAFDVEPHHIAILISGNRIVHAYLLARRCVVQSYCQHWRDVTVAAYSFPGIQ